MDICRDWKSEMSEIYTRQVKTIWRVCFSYMKNPVDTDDMVQETFVRLMIRRIS